MINENYLNQANYFMYESYSDAEQDVIEEGLKDFIFPILTVASMFISNAEAKDLKLKDIDLVNKIESIKQKSSDEFDNQMNMFIKKGTNLKNDVSEIVSKLNSDLEKNFEKIKDQAFEVVVDEKLDAPFKIDTKNKKLIVKDWKSIKNLDGIKKAINKGSLKVDENKVNKNINTNDIPNTMDI
jgi:hypothetical protein